MQPYLIMVAYRNELYGDDECAFGHVNLKHEANKMHKSRLGEITIDCKTNDLSSAAQFWENVLGYRAKSFEDHYQFDTPGDDIRINLQKVAHPSRVHLDIETDNIEAEVRRIEQLGGRQLREARRWVVMSTPTGHGLCICQPARSLFSTRAHQWR